MKTKTVELTKEQGDALAKIAFALGIVYESRDWAPTAEELNGKRVHSAYPYFELRGDCFVFTMNRFNAALSFEEMIATLAGVKVRKRVYLNAEYTAFLDGDEIVVGCQRFPKTKVKELYDTFYEKK